MFEKELKVAIDAALKAKEVILKVYRQDDFHVEIKDDDSPVTMADKQADELIRKILHEAFPDHGMLTEESSDDLTRLENDFVWIVDPVDGTKDFVSKDDEFTTCIALSYKHQIVVGVICAPALDELYFASKGNGAFYKKGDVVEKIHVNDKVDDLICLTSVFHLNEKEEEVIKKHSIKIKSTMKKGSSLKACYIAHGKAEISYRFTDKTKEWDTAACDIIVKEAGGLFLTPSGNDIVYNRKDMYNRDGYVIINRIENFLL